MSIKELEMLVNPESIDTFVMTRFFIASNMGIILLVGVFLALNTKENTKSNYFGLFLIMFSMGIFIATGTPLDVFLVGLTDEDKNIDFTNQYKIFISFGIFVALSSFYFLYKIKTFKNIEIGTQNIQ